MSGCGCAAPRAAGEPCACGGRKPQAAAAPVAAPAVAGGPDRLALFEDFRRSGFAVAFPDDPARPPPHESRDGREAVSPAFGKAAPRSRGGPCVPAGTALDCEEFYDVAFPDGTAGPAGGPLPALEGRPRREGDLPAAPPEYLSRTGGEAERLLPAQPPPEARPARVPPSAPAPLAPGQTACAQDPAFPHPTEDPFLLAPQPPEARGKGGGREVEQEQVELRLWADPCPCKCVCEPVSNVLQFFVDVIWFPIPFFGLLRAGRATGKVVATPDSVLEEVRESVVARGGRVTFDPLADGLTASGAAAAARPPRRPREVLVYPELTGSLDAADAQALLVTPVGPGPGLPGVGARPLVPADGALFRAAPGSLPAGVAPAAGGYGLEEFGVRARGTLAGGGAA